MNLDRLAGTISTVHRQAQAHAGLAVNQVLNHRNWLIGAYIVEYEQGGEDRAEYGEQVLKELARRLNTCPAGGLSLTNLKGFRKVALTWPLLAKGQTLSDLFGGGMGRAPSTAPLIPMGVSPSPQSPQEASAQLEPPSVATQFPTLEARKPALEWQDAAWTAKLFASLSFSHLLELARLEDPLPRAFYELECLRSGWSVRELKRQRDSMLFERVGLSKDRAAVLSLAEHGRLVDTPGTILRDPYVLEFTGLERRAAWTETDLEAALLRDLEMFLLELGHDFCFVERQVRVTVGGRHHYLDLLFFHRGLRCLIAIELKLGPFHYEDGGQMNFYLNYLRENATREGENPPVGIVLCADKDAGEVHYATAGLDNAVFVSRYLVALPSEEQLRDFLRREQELLARRAPPDAE
ncbi:DUF1016 family protein [Candidatus Poribacteria bacterium]|nr:DUF1016 family protein [Candidatus Poribacteria bacterium]